jgi:hypothetical protein
MNDRKPPILQKNATFLEQMGPASNVSADPTGELVIEYEGRVWRVVRSTAIKDAIQIEYEA